MLRLTDPPKLHPTAGVIPPDEMKAMALWIADVHETRVGLDGCPLVQQVDE